MISQNPIGIISDEVSQDLEKVIQFALEFALDGIEIRSVAGKAFMDITPADAREIHARLSDAGLAVACGAAPVFKCDLEDRTEIARHIDIFRRSLDHALLWECKVLRVFAFLRKGTLTSVEHLKRSAEYFNSLLEALDGSEVTIGIENEATTLVCTSDEMASFLDLLPDQRIGVVWDSCNVLFLPEHPKSSTGDFSCFANRVRHVYVKDARRENGGQATHCVEVGTGDLDFRAQFRQLREVDYRGWITLETHWRTQSLTAEQAHLPAGDAFSANAEGPSRICMERLKSLLQSA